MAPRRLPRGVPKTAPWAGLALVAVVLAVWGARAPRHPSKVQPRPIARPPTPATYAVATRPSPRFCDTDAACDGGTCDRGRCGSSITDIDDAECARDADCGLAMRCDQGLCFDGSRTCPRDARCAPGERCAGGRCTPGVRDCAADADCPAGHCALGACEPGPPPGAAACHNDRACPEGRCADGACLPGLRECLDGRDCPSELRCDQGLCRPARANTPAP